MIMKPEANWKRGSIKLCSLSFWFLTFHISYFTTQVL